MKLVNILTFAGLVWFQFADDRAFAKMPACQKVEKEITLKQQARLWWDLMDPSDIRWIGKSMDTKAIRFYQKKVFDYVSHDVQPTDVLEVVSPNVRKFLKLEDGLEKISISDAIDLNLDFEQQLIREALKNKPHEVAQIRLFLSDGTVKIGKLLHGKATSMPNKPWKEIKKMIKKLRPILSEDFFIVEIEYAHVHPMYEFINRTQNELVTVPISFSDVVGIEEASYKVKGILVSMKAVIPNGYSYRNTYLGGEQYSRERHWKDKGLLLPVELRRKNDSKFSLGKTKKNALDTRTTGSLIAEYVSLKSPKNSQTRKRSKAIKKELLQHRFIDPEKLDINDRI